MSDGNKHVRTWDGNAFEDVWSHHALRATVVIESGEKDTLAVLVDETGQRAQFHIPTHKVSAFLDVASHAWQQRKAGGSIAIVWQRGLNALGVVGPPPPPPPPGPPGDEAFVASALMGHHQMLGALEVGNALGRSRQR